jgi:hypothetical protein
VHHHCSADHHSGNPERSQPSGEPHKEPDRSGGFCEDHERRQRGRNAHAGEVSDCAGPTRAVEPADELLHTVRKHHERKHDTLKEQHA